MVSDMNFLSPYVGDTVTRQVRIVWRTDEGLYEYRPKPEDTVTIRFYDEDHKLVATEDAEFKDGRVMVSFPTDQPAGFYEYNIVLKRNNEEFTIAHSAIYLRRR